MRRGSSPNSFIGRFLENSSLIRHYLWKYRTYVCLGLGTLVVLDGLEILPPLFLKQAVDLSTAGTANFGELRRIAALYLAVALIQGVCRYGWRMYLIRASMFAGQDMRQSFTEHLFGLSTSFFDRRPIGELMSLATNDIEAVRMELGAGILVFADSLFYLLTVPVAMYWLSPQLTLLTFVTLPLVPWLVYRNEREVHTRFEKVQKCFAELSAMAQESLSGVRVLKGFSREEAQVARFKRKGDEFVKLNLSLAKVQTSFGPTLDFVMSVGMVLLLFVGGRWMITPGARAVITLGTFVAFQRYIQKIVWPMAALGMSVGYYQRAVSSSNRLKEVQAIHTDVPESSQPLLPALVEGRTLGRFEFRNLVFCFPGTDRAVLNGISLTIEAGERVAFVGAVGAGKSALLSLLPRMYPVERGMLWIDGVDINDWPLEELRRQVGFVSQDVFLFSETVTENVAFGLLNWAKSPGLQSRSIEDAARLAGVHDEVLGLSQSYQTRLGERGVNLSGGQKQRLTIARAIAKHPSILVMDDALSSVDVQTEEQILQGLRSRSGRNTEIIAAHRISTIKDADRIVVLADGKIRQVGTHAELSMDRRGLYRQFYEQQRLQEDLESYVERLDVSLEESVT
ncbi:ABC transporter ATP-binding protein [Bdellovibrionota bacterium FG-1]